MELTGLIGPALNRMRAQRRERKLRGMDEEAAETIREVAPYTMLGPAKLFSLIQSVRYVTRYGVPGDIVECGVWRGGAVMAAAITLAGLGSKDRRFFLYDTFTGMPAPTDEDLVLGDGKDPQKLFQRRRVDDGGSDWCRAGIEEVRWNLATLPYAQHRFELVRGRVQDTIPGTLPGRIAILRLDTDWYESTRHELEHLMPLLSPGGVLIVDDYYGWAGNQKAVDEYLDREGLPMLLTKVSSSAVGVVPLGAPR